MTDLPYDTRCLASLRDWSGYVTLENLKALADRVEKLLTGSTYTWVEVYEYAGYRPRVRTGQTVKKVTLHETADSSGRTGAVIVSDSYGVWSLPALCKTQADAEKHGDRMGQAYVELEQRQMRVTFRTPEGKRGYWLVAVTPACACTAESGADLDEVTARLAAEVEQLRARDATITEFLNARIELVRTLRQCVDANSDYYRWQGHAEARRVLATMLGVPVPWPAEDAAKKTGGEAS